MPRLVVLHACCNTIGMRPCLSLGRKCQATQEPTLSDATAANTTANSIPVTQSIPPAGEQRGVSCPIHKAASACKCEGAWLPCAGDPVIPAQPLVRKASSRNTFVWHTLHVESHPLHGPLFHHTTRAQSLPTIHRPCRPRSASAPTIVHGVRSRAHCSKRQTWPSRRREDGRRTAWKASRHAGIEFAHHVKTLDDVCSGTLCTHEPAPSKSTQQMGLGITLLPTSKMS